MTLAIIDAGTNSIHLLIGTLGRQGRFRVILKERDLTRLGDGWVAGGRLTDAAMRRAMAILRRYAATLKRHRVDRVDAVATSAVREANNGRSFVRRVRARVGLPLRIISGKEEARLIYLGVRHAHHIRRSALIVAIGGGSAQIVCGDGGRLRYAASLPLGCARLAQRFIRHDPPQVEELDALRRYTRRAWSPVVRAIRRHRWRVALGCSATIAQVMTTAHVRRYRRLPRRTQPLAISQPALRELVGWLSTSTSRERAALAGVDPKRQDLLLTTSVTLLTWMEGCGVSTVRYAQGSLRDGLIATDSGSPWHGPTRQRR